MAKKSYLLISRRERWGLTWKGWLLLMFLLAAFMAFFTFRIVPFLSAENPNYSKILVLEGYVEDWAYPEIISRIEEIKPEFIITTGTSLDQGFYLSGVPSTAYLTARSLIKLGIDSSLIHVVPVEPDVLVNRTYNSAITVRKWLEANSPETRSINLVSTAVHARRSHYLFKMAMKPHIQTGNIVIPPRYFNSKNWFRTSRGFRVVLSETIAWFYVRLFFSPDVEKDLSRQTKDMQGCLISTQQIKNEKNRDILRFHPRAHQSSC